jgi:hypothetical protein
MPRAVATRSGPRWLVASLAVGVACGGTAPRPADQGARSAPADAGAAPVPDASPPAPGAAPVDAAVGDSGVADDAAPQPRPRASGDDPVPWRWIAGLAAEEGETSTGPMDGPLDVSSVDLDGDGQEELVASWTVGQGMCNCERRAAVARRTGADTQTVLMANGTIRVVDLPGGLRGVLNYPSDFDTIFELLALRPGARQMTSIFEGDYDSGGSAEVTCTLADGGSYEASPDGAPYFVERNGQRVLEEFREYDGCGDEHAPPTRVRRVEDLLRRAHFLDAGGPGR